MLTIERNVSRGFCPACELSHGIEYKNCRQCGGALVTVKSAPEPKEPERVTLSEEKIWRDPFHSVD